MKNREEIDIVLYGYELHKIHKDLVIEAIQGSDWDFKTQFNGCTAVSDLLYLGFPIDCLVHDFHWITGRGGKLSDEIFYSLMIARGVPKWRAKKRYLGVRIGWFGFYKWKHLFKGNRNKPTRSMLNWKNKNKK